MTGAAFWGSYGFARLAVCGLIAMRMRSSDVASHHITDRLIKARAPVRSWMTAITVCVGVATAIWIGL